MSRKKLLIFIVTGALTMALAVGAFVYTSVSAQDDTPTPETPAQKDALRPPRGDYRGQVMEESLAAALGIEVADLQAARQTAAEEALEQAVSAGLITQEQADRLAERGAGRLPFLGRKGSIGDTGIDYNALLAKALNISVEKLNAAYQEAFTASIDQAVADGKMTEEQADLAKGRYALSNNSAFRESMQSAFEAAVRQAVTSGVITQEQADQILANQNGAGVLGRGGFFGPRGRHGHGKMPGGFLPHDTNTTPSGDDI